MFQSYVTKNFCYDPKAKMQLVLIDCGSKDKNEEA